MRNRNLTFEERQELRRRVSDERKRRLGHQGRIDRELKQWRRKNAGTRAA